MSFWKNPIVEIESFINPSNEQKALNFLNTLLGLFKMADSILDPVLALYAPLAPVASLIDGGVSIVEAGIAELQKIIASK